MKSILASFLGALVGGNAWLAAGGELITASSLLDFLSACVAGWCLGALLYICSVYDKERKK